jgi:hypothetical protein
MTVGDVEIRRESFTSDDVQALAQWMGLSEATGGRYSALFCLGLHAAALQGKLNPARVVQQIRAMEGLIPPTGLKPPTKFTRQWLSGLWHQHYQYPGIASMTQNLLRGWQAEVISPWFKERIDAAKAGTGPKYFTEEDIPALANDLVSGTYQRRKDAQALTGEWIVYAVHQGKNYYLAIWEHPKGKGNSDEMLRRQIEQVCVTEFPFLKGILAPLPS